MKNIYRLFFIVILSIWSCKLFQSNSSPKASFTITPTTGTVETIFSFDASGSTDEEDSSEDLIVRWDWEDDGGYDTDWSTNKSATHQFDYSPDYYTVKLQVKDSDGSKDMSLKTLSLSNAPPTASFTISPNEGNTLTEFTFDASSSTDIENEITDLDVRWDWNNDGDWDEDYTRNKLINKRFDAASIHTITLEVTDPSGLADTLSTPLEVLLGCGGHIIEDYVFTEDFNCDVDDDLEVLKITTSNITIDLGGFKITNASNNPEKVGIEIHNAQNVTLRNGTIDGFMFGIDIRNSTNATIENVKIKNMKIAHTDSNVFGISSTNSQNVNISNSEFDFIKEHHKSAIIGYQSSINVNNIVTRGGGVPVSFSYATACAPGSADHNNGGTITNSTFIDAHTAGIWIGCCDGAIIQGNEFIRNEIAIQAYCPHFGSISNLLIEENYMHDGFQGIDFMGITESTINNNIIQNNSRGIYMNQSHECAVGNTNDNCFYSTGNTISNNTLTGNYLDLGHHELAVGNIWINNTCQTKEGSEIPDCTE